LDIALEAERFRVSDLSSEPRIEKESFGVVVEERDMATESHDFSMFRDAVLCISLLVCIHWTSKLMLWQLLTFMKKLNQ
jgi:hypothetical protein